MLLAAAGQRALRECPKSIPLLCCSPRFTSQGSHSPISIRQRTAVAAQKGLHLLPCTGSAAGFGKRLVTQDLQRQPGDMKHITHTQLPHPSPWVCCCLAVSYSTLLPLTPAVRAPPKPAFSCHGERGTGCKQASKQLRKLVTAAAGQQMSASQVDLTWLLVSRCWKPCQTPRAPECWCPALQTLPVPSLAQPFKRRQSGRPSARQHIRQHV